MIEDTPPGTRVPPTDRRPLRELVRDLGSDIASLVRQEIALAKAEIQANLKNLAKNSGILAVGGGIASVGLVVLTVFLIVWLGAILGGAYWLSTLLVALGLLAAGGAMAYLGAKKLGRTPLKPETTLQSLRDTREWASAEAASFRQALTGNGATRTALPAAAPAAAVPAGVDEREVRSVPSPAVAASGVPERSSAVAPYSPARAPAPAPPRDRPAHALPAGEPLYRRVFHEIGADGVPGQAAQVAYYMFTSLPPALLVLFSLAGFFGGPQLGDFLTTQLEGTLPGSADDPDSAAGFISQFIEQVVTQRAPGPLSIGLVLGIWASSAVFAALGESLNQAYDLVEDRSWVKRRAIALGVMIAFLALFLAGSGILIVGPRLVEALALGGATRVAWAILQWPVAFLLVVAAFFLVYYVLPNRDQSGRAGVLFKGSAIAAALWLLATLGFRFYIANFGSYGETYGFVGAILVLLLWMYVTAMVILIGGEISSELEKEVGE